MRMYNPPHPAELLLELWINPMSLTLTDLAQTLNVPLPHLSSIVNEHTSVTPEIALRLELAFGKSAQSWLAHQATYDLSQIEGSRNTLGVRPLRSVKQVQDEPVGPSAREN